MSATGLYTTKPALQRLLRPVVQRLANRRVSPDELTLAGVAASLAAAGLILGARVLPLAAALLVARLLLNVLDGQLARAAGRCSRRGELLNEVGDRVSDTAVLMAVGLSGLVDARLALAALAAVSLVESVALLARPRLQLGLFGKGDRMVLLALALPLGGLAPALWAITGLSLVTLAQRWRWLRGHGSA